MNQIEKKYQNDNAKFALSNEDHIAEIAKICYALSNEFRVNILRQIRQKPQTIIELAEKNYTAISTMVFHIDILYDAGLLNIDYIKGKKGPIRKCFAKLLNLEIDLNISPILKNDKKITYTMGVGQFVDACCNPDDCSFATKTKIHSGTFGALFHRERFEADLFWSRSGFLAYAFPREFKEKSYAEISISLEICSETYFFNQEYKSDITFWINDIELCTYTCPGDYGDRKGKLNPDWWPMNSSQYGELKTLKITEHGVYLDGKIMNPNITIKDLNLENKDHILFKLGNKNNAKNIGGFNIFGKGFGDYDQDIVMTVLLIDD